MNREAVLNQLSNPDRAQELYLRMKRLPSDSPAFISLHQCMTHIDAFRPPRGVKQKHIIQNIISFSPLRPTWLSHRLVCKDWRHAIESMRFNARIEDFRPIPEDSDEEYEDERYDIENAVKFPGAVFLLTRLTKLDIFDFFDAEGERTLLKVAKNMKEIKFWVVGDEDAAGVADFTSKLLLQSQDTLTNLKLSSPCLPCELPNLKFLEVPTYKSSVEDVAKLLKTLDLDYVQEIRFVTISPAVATFIAQNYASYCCSAHADSSRIRFNTNVLPVVAVMPRSLNAILGMKYPERVEYIFAEISMIGRIEKFGYGWDKAKESLSIFPNLKEVHAVFCSGICDEIIFQERKRALKEVVANLGVKLIEVKATNYWRYSHRFAKEIPFDGCRFNF